MERRQDMEMSQPGSHAGKQAASTGDGATSGMGMAPRYTRPQLVAVSAASLLSLAATIVLSAFSTNLKLSSREVGGAIMPPGMIMTYDTPGQSMVDMAAVDPREVT